MNHTKFIDFLVLTTTYVYERHCYKISAFLSVILCCVSLLATSSLYLSNFNDEERRADDQYSNIPSPSYVEQVAFSPSGLYAIYVELLLLMYTVVPLPLIGTLVIGVVYR